MDPLLVQNLRYKLQKRVRRLNSSTHNTFASNLYQFWVFFDRNDTFAGIVQTLLSQNPQAETKFSSFKDGESISFESEEEAAAIGYHALRWIPKGEDGNYYFSLTRAFRTGGKASEALEVLCDVFLEPFYEYVDEQLDDQRAMLGVLMRYKHRSEWFFRDRLAQVATEETRKAEKNLAKDLYAYLHDQGIDFSIEPSSIDGEIDLIAAQHTSDPLLADAKVFDGQDRGKKYIRKGFNQIYSYCQKYNEPFGYLVIYKITDKDLHFALKNTSSNVPVVVCNHKTIFLITIDIYQHTKPVSQRDPLQAVTITEEELIQSIEEEVEV